MTSSPAHSAAGPALGYIYQCQAALLELMPHALAGTDATVTLEIFDDVAIDYGADTPKRVLQVNHSLNSEGELLDTSAKTWRTLAIWSQEWTALEPSQTRVMTLLTTLHARPGSALQALTQSSPRDVDLALTTLTEIAQDADGPAGTAKDRATFLALEPLERRELLQNVTVADGALQAMAMRTRLQELLAPTHEHRFIPAMADSVEGAWWPLAVAALAGRLEVSADILREAIDEARRSLSDHALPILRIEDFEDGELPSFDPVSARFLLCLRAIAASDLRLQHAQQDYQRAFAHRSRGARRGLLGPHEYERYEDELFARWLIAAERMLRSLGEDADADALASGGHELWDTMEVDVSQPLRPETPDGFIQRGSLHQLANDERLAWHPYAARERIDSASGGQEAA